MTLDSDRLQITWVSLKRRQPLMNCRIWQLRCWGYLSLFEASSHLTVTCFSVTRVPTHALQIISYRERAVMRFEGSETILKRFTSWVLIELILVQFWWRLVFIVWELKTKRPTRRMCKHALHCVRTLLMGSKDIKLTYTYIIRAPKLAINSCIVLFIRKL